jgi:uncharacterized protein YprB with RNaseH-like and TPR domain
LLENTFIHVPGVGRAIETELWEQDCHDWRSFLASPSSFSSALQSAPAMRPQDLAEELELSVGALAVGHHQYFRHRLAGETWRAWPNFRDRCVYLDIETDGGREGAAITTIGMWDGKDFTCLVRDQDLGNFIDHISQYSMIVTFFGASFDLPMLQKRFKTWKPDQIHIDLCPTLKRLNHHGGLKKIEKQLGISRGEDTDGLSGRDAITLWNRFYRNHDDSALATLIAYNREDVVNLESLMDYAYHNLRHGLRGAYEGTEPKAAIV